MYIVSVFCIVFLCVGCSYRVEKLTEAETKGVNGIVRGLIEADIIFPFDSTKDIPLAFFPTYLSMRYSSGELQLTDEMQANINYQQMMSIIQPDWGIEKVSLDSFSHEEEKFLITLQFGLQGKNYVINKTTKDKDAIRVSVTIEKSLDSISNNVIDAGYYTYTINYKFKAYGNHVTLISASTDSPNK